MGQRKRNRRLAGAFRLAQTWRFDKVIEAFAEPTAVLTVHQRACTVMFTFVCTCRPVFVAPPARA